MRALVAIPPSRVARTVLVPEVLPADDDAAEPAALPLEHPRRTAGRAADVVGYAVIAPARGDLVDVYG